MANAITLRKTYSTLLDEAYKLASLTAVLDGPNDLAQEGANANEILIPKMSMSGLADYDKQTADAWKFGYRTVGIAEAKDNKKVAIYVHKAGE